MFFLTEYFVNWLNGLFRVVCWIREVRFAVGSNFSLKIADNQKSWWCVSRLITAYYKFKLGSIVSERYEVAYLQIRLSLNGEPDIQGYSCPQKSTLTIDTKDLSWVDKKSIL